MKLAKRSGELLAALALSFCLALSVSAQGRPTKKAAAKPGTAKAASTAKVAVSAKRASSPAQIRPTSVSLEGKRDPFVPLLSTSKGPSGHLPPGKAGLVISTVQVDGAVQAPSGMIAVVSNPEQRVYFVREGDRLYDGQVEKIGMDGVTFRENTKDAFGRPVERVVTKRIYASAGEQQ
jgi:Tfp pilus assembly protein PilP